MTSAITSELPTIRSESRNLLRFPQAYSSGYWRIRVESRDGKFQTYSTGRLAPLLIIFGGLPGTGKTAIARELAHQVGALYVRIDSIEQAIRDSERVNQPLNDVGYRVAYAIAEDNLRLGSTVISDSVNPIQLTRDAWMAVAHRVQVRATEVEVSCSDPQQHRQRVETRAADIRGLRLPTWEEVMSREYEPWGRKHIVIDTTGRSVAECVEELREALQK